MTREELAAELYAINYVKPCFKKDTAFYLTPKQAFKAADKFLAEAKRQANPCDHEWGYVVAGRDVAPNIFTCTKCYAIRPMNPKSTISFVGGVTVGETVTSGRAVISEPAKAKREFWLDFNAVGLPMHGWPGDMPRPQGAIRVREILDTEEGEKACLK